MIHPRQSVRLRQALLADAVISGASGLLMLLGAGMLDGLLDLPATLLRSAGLVLIPFVSYVAYIATRGQIRRADVWAVIWLNVLWAAGSLMLLVSGWVAPNLLGILFVAVQALAVALFAELQYMGIRRSLEMAA